MPKGRIITTLRDRPQIEAALEALARARTEPEAQALLRTLTGYGLAVLPIVLHHLDTPDPWMVRAMGRLLAQLRDRRRVTASLRRTILDPGSSDRRRIVAMVLLDQFLGQPLDEALFSALGNPTEVATNALLRDTPPDERPARLDYLSILHVQQPEDILRALDRFYRQGSEQAIAGLTFFALDERGSIADAALDRLGKIRRPAALRALRILESNVPSARRPAVERLLRKLRFSGVPEEPLPPPAGARVLISQVDGGGNRLLLFLFPQEDAWRGLHIFVDDEQGVRSAYELPYTPGELPAPAGLGAVLPAPHPWRGVSLLEGSWDYARQVLRSALLLNEAQASLCPLEYRFVCDQVWGWTVPSDEPPPILPPAEADWPLAVSSLLATDYLASWFLESEGIYRAAMELLAADFTQPAFHERLAQIVQSLLQAEWTAEVSRRYSGRLHAMAGWLARAGERRWASIAQAAAREVEAAGAAPGVFARLILQKGLLYALDDLRQKLGL